jgi:predicted dehydrogenase
MYRYHPRILAAHKMVLDGAIGDLKTIESAFTYRKEDTANIRFKPEMGGGALMDVGCYSVSISRMMAGREPRTVQARMYRTSTGVDDQLVGMLDFGDGLIAHFDCAMNQEDRQRCLLAGSRGYLEIPNSFKVGVEETWITEQKGEGSRQEYRFEGVNIYTLMAEDFMHSIAGRPPRFPIEDALGNMRTILALAESALKNGQPVDL